MEYRLDVGAMKKKVANSGNRLPLPTVPLMSLCTLVVLAIVFSYAKRTKLMKTGRHKKCDGDC